MELNIFNLLVICFVMSIEDWFGVCLLNCIICSLLLIDVGYFYLVQICYVIDEIDWVEEMIVLMYYELIGLLKIVVFVMFGMYVFVLVIDVFKMCYLVIVLEVMIVDCYVDFVLEGFDVGLLLFQYISNNMLVKCLFMWFKQIVCVVLYYVDWYGVFVYLYDFVLYVCLLFYVDFMGEYLLFDYDQMCIIVCLNKFVLLNNVGLICNWVLFGMGIVVLLDFFVQLDFDDG